MHPRVASWACLEKQWFQTDSVKSRLPWLKNTDRYFSSENSPEGAPLKYSPMNCLSTRTHQILPTISMSAKSYEGFLNVDNFEGGTLMAHPVGRILGLSIH